METVAAAGGIAFIVASVATGMHRIVPWTRGRERPDLAAGAPPFAAPAEG